MTKETQFLFWLALMLLWLGLICAAMLFLFYRYPRRFAFAAAVGGVTALVALVGVLLGFAPNDPSAWGFSLLLGTFAFITSLLWLWLTPTLAGKSWDDFIVSITKQIEDSRKGRH